MNKAVFGLGEASCAVSDPLLSTPSHSMHVVVGSAADDLDQEVRNSPDRKLFRTTHVLQHACKLRQ